MLLIQIAMKQKSIIISNRNCMKKYFVLSSLLLFLVGVSAQAAESIGNSGEFYLKQDLKIGNIEVKKVAGDFVILSDSNISIKKIVTNYYNDYESHKPKDGKKLPVLFEVEKFSNGEKSVVFNEDFLNSFENSELKSKPDFLFILEPYSYYKISQGDLHWNVYVRKKVEAPSNLDVLWLNSKTFRIGNDTISTNDSTGYRLIEIDSLKLSSWDSDFTLIQYKNGKETVLSYSVQEIDDSCYYLKKCNVFEDGYNFIIGDTLVVRIESKHSSYGFAIVGQKQESLLWWFILIIPLLIVICFVLNWRKVKAVLRLRRIKSYRKNRLSQEVKDSINNTSIKRELAIMFDNLLKNVPKQIKQNFENQLFRNFDDIEAIEKDLNLIYNTKGIGPKTRERCTLIRTFISNHIEVWPAKDSQQLVVEERDCCDVEQTVEENISKGSLFKQVNHILDTLVTEGKIKESVDEKERSIIIDRDALSKLKEAVGTLEKRVDIESKEAIENVKNEAEQSKQSAINEAVKAEKQANEAAMKELEVQKNAAERKAELAEQTKARAVRDAEQTVKRANEAKIKELSEEVVKVGNKLQIIQKTLAQTQQVLSSTTMDRDAKAKEILKLEKSQEQFTRHLSSVPFAEKYCKQIHSIIELGGQILREANSLMDIGIKDPYFIIKALAKYGKSVDTIDMEGFLTEVNMAAKAQFVFKESSLASPTFTSDSKDIENIVKEYFFKQYLEKYVNALMVLNESMCGLKLLLPEIKSKVEIFEKYRSFILECIKKLQINILYVKVGDMAGENVDLKAKAIDVRIGTPGQILEIENCIIYLNNNQKPPTKIRVTIKK